MARATCGSSSTTTVTSGASSLSPSTSRACAVCSTGTRYGCAPAVRSAASLSTFGPSAASSSFSRGTSRRSRYDTSLSYGFSYAWSSCLWPTPTPSTNLSLPRRWNSAETFSGSVCQTFVIPVATVIDFVASSTRSTSAVSGELPIQNVPNPSDSISAISSILSAHW